MIVSFHYHLSETTKTKMTKQMLDRAMHMCNMKALSLLVSKLWPRLKFSISRSNFKVKVTKSKITVPHERSCPKQCTCAI